MGVALVSLEVKKYDRIVQLPATVEEGTLHALCKLACSGDQRESEPKDRKFLLLLFLCNGDLTLS